MAQHGQLQPATSASASAAASAAMPPESMLAAHANAHPPYFGYPLGAIPSSYGAPSFGAPDAFPRLGVSGLHMGPPFGGMVSPGPPPAAMLAQLAGYNQHVQQMYPTYVESRF